MVGAAVLVSVLAAPASRLTAPAATGRENARQAQGQAQEKSSQGSGDKGTKGREEPLDLAPVARRDYSGELAQTFLDVCREDRDLAEPAEPAASASSGQVPDATTDWWTRDAFPGDEESANRLLLLHARISSLCHTRPEQFIIALVPDPVHTRLALSFDRAVEVIQEAAQDDGYAFVKAIMPWDPKAHPESDDPESRLKDRSYVKGREELPGLLAFRKVVPGSLPGKARQAHLFVLVVGESPTRGIIKKQFSNAREWIRATTREPSPELRILGPTFSGSLASLAQLLRCQSASVGDEPGEPQPCDPAAAARAGHGGFRIYSGTITNRASVLRFLGEESNLGATFASFQEADDVMIDRFVEYLTGSFYGRHGYEPDKIAILSEDETEYGYGGSSRAPATDSCKHCLQLLFPREISRLRAAYQSSEVKAPGSDAASAPSDVLPLDLEISGADDDSVAAYSKQAPLSQEGVLLGIVSDLRKRAVQIVLLRATDPLDLLFLSRYLAAAYPKARIVTLGADLLFRREAEDRNLHGILALSTYAPIPFADREFMHSRGNPERNFPSSMEAGDYNALRALLALPRAAQPKHPERGRLELSAKKLYLYQYGWPEGWRRDWTDHDTPSTNTPPVHLLALGRDEYWPVAHLGPIPRVTPGPTEHFQTLLPLVTTPQFIVDDKADVPDLLAVGRGKPLRYPVNTSWVAAELAACLLAFGFAGSLWFSSIFSRSQPLAQFAPAVTGVRELLVVASTFMLMSILSILLFPFIAGGSLWHIERGAGLQLLLWAALAAVFLAALTDLSSRGCLEAQTAPDPARKKGDHRRLRRLACQGALIMPILAVASVYAWIEVSRTSAEGAPTGAWRFLMVRSMQLSSGLSPILPMLLLLAAGLWWAYQVSSGAALLDDRRPQLPRGVRRPSVQSIAEHQQNRIVTELLRALLPRPSGASYVLLCAAGVVLPCVLGLCDALKSLENSGVALTLRLFALAALVLILHTTWRLWSIWQKTRSLLVMLDSLPLRRGFQLLEGFSWQPLWRFGLLSMEAFQRNLARVMEALTLAVETTWVDAPAVFPEGKEGMRQLEPLRALALQATSPELDEPAREHAERHLGRPPAAILKRLAFAYRMLLRRSLELEIIEKFGEFQCYTAMQAGHALDYLATSWDKEKEGRKKRRKDETQQDWNLRACERFVCLVYVGFLLVVLIRIRTLMMAIGGMYILIMAAMTVYPFQPQALIQGLLALLLLAVIAVVTTVFAQIHRDATLSHIMNTNPGELGSDFWIRTTSFVALPLFSFFVSQFPQVNRVFYSWLEPALKALNK